MLLCFLFRVRFLFRLSYQMRFIQQPQGFIFDSTRFGLCTFEYNYIQLPLVLFLLFYLPPIPLSLHFFFARCILFSPVTTDYFCLHFVLFACLFIHVVRSPFMRLSFLFNSPNSVWIIRLFFYIRFYASIERKRASDEWAKTKRRS